MHVGKVDKPLPMLKIMGFDIPELIKAWAKIHCRVGDYLVLYDVNIDGKPAQFWRSIPDRDKKELLSDVVIVKCKSSKEAMDMCKLIEPDFAQALTISDGRVSYWFFDQ